jgi:eukaryotic-like serine/threonine-protein kinase
MESIQNFPSNTWNFLTSHWQLMGLVNLAILAFISYTLYRYTFSAKGAWLREKFAFLRKVSAEKDVTDYIKDGEYARAGEILLSMKRYKEAIKVFMDGKLYGRAADIYFSRKQLDHAANLYDMAGDFERAADIFIQTKNFEQAEKCLSKLERSEEIPKIYLRHNLNSLAAQSMIKLGQLKEAAELFAQEGNYKKAGDLMFDFYKKEKARLTMDGSFLDDDKIKAVARLGGEFLANAKDYEKAGILYMSENLYSDAAKSFERGGDLDRAIEFNLKGNLYHEAAELLRKRGDHKKAAYIEAEALSHAGEEFKAVKLYQEAGDFAKAGDIYRSIQDFEKAAIMYEKAKEYSLACSAYAEAKIYDHAAECAEKMKDFDKAIEYYGRAQDYAKQVSLQEKLGKFYQAAVNYNRRSLNDEALACLSKIKDDSPDFSSALALYGRIYMEQGEFSKAKENLQKAVENAKSISKSNIDSFTNLAALAEKLDSEPSILKTIEKMLADDLIENDVKDKVDNLRNKLNYFAISRLSKMASREGSSKFAEPQINVSNAAKIEKKRYIKVKEIGRGGMGIVYTAKDTTLDRIVALKILPATLKKNPQAVKTFLREAKSAAALNHSNIVTVFDAGVEDDEYYIAMELISGYTIKEILRKNHKLSLPSVLEVLKQLLAGLNYAHKKNIVHRDLTTNNIMWSKEKVVKIMDFGLAKVVKDLLSEQSIIGGTPSFMSPEQTLGKPIDHRTDIYSLGICLFQMLIGELPFKKGDLGYHHLHTIPPAPKSLDNSIPEALNDIILKCMEKDPAKRFQSCEEIDKIAVTQLAQYAKK